MIVLKLRLQAGKVVENSRPSLMDCLPRWVVHIYATGYGSGQAKPSARVLVGDYFSIFASRHGANSHLRTGIAHLTTLSQWC